MKPIIALLSALLISSFAASAQASKHDTLPYQKYHSLPAMNLLSPDSAHVFNFYNIPEGRPTVLFFFSPDCEHCQKTTELLLAKMDSLKDADFYFMTPMSLTMLRPFMAKYHLPSYKNIIAGKDYQYFFPAYYGAKTVPYTVVYDRKKQFVRLWDGGPKMSALIRVIDSLK